MMPSLSFASLVITIEIKITADTVSTLTSELAASRVSENMEARASVLAAAQHAL
jgi:hypothetical protein